MVPGARMVTVAFVFFVSLVGLFVWGAVALVGRWTKSPVAKALAAVGALVIVFLALAAWFDSCVHFDRGPLIPH